MKVLLTGGAGYIGSHTVKHLISKGITPIVFDNLQRGGADIANLAPLEQGSILNTEHLYQVMRRWEPVAVIHFAALAYVGESMQHPEDYYHTNVAGTISLLQAMRQYGLNKIVFSSSCATYGNPSVLPITEESPQVPTSPYGASKLMVERILNDFDAAYGMRNVTLRYFNAAGADAEGEIGENHNPETHLIPLAIQAAMGIKTAIFVNGDDYGTPDGTCMRDYVHVSDLAQAHYLALQYLLNGNPSDTFNIGSDAGYSVLEVIRAVAAVSGNRVNFAIGPRRAGDAESLVASSEKIRRVLGWEPEYTNLWDIVQTAWNWHSKKVPA